MTPAGVPPHLDHIVLAGPSLAEAADWFARRTGVTAAPGGSHPGWGTANRLVDLGAGAYLEIIGPDADQPAPAHARPFRVDELDAPRVVAWAVHPPDADAAVLSARRRGYDPGRLAAMSRAAPGGQLLRWRLTPPVVDGGGLLPFVIDWGATAHPTTRQLPLVPLVSFGARHPDPARIRTQLAALGTALPVDTATTPALDLVVEGPSGPVRIA